jgi:ABC-2 type transport system ATP-binding protein
VASLSGGQRQKLSIVLALIPNPRVVFLDELTTGLDPHARRQMWDLLLQLRERGLTIVLVSHYMDEVEAVCDRVAIMNRGRMVSIGSINEVVNQFNLKTAISFHASLQNIRDIKDLAGVVSVMHNRDAIKVCGHGDECVAAVLQYLKDNRVDYSNLAVKRPDLEAVFLSLAGYDLAEDHDSASNGGRG